MERAKGGSSKLLWVVIVLSVFCTFACFPGCGSRKKPSTVVEEMCRTTERGEIDQAAAFLSQGFVSREGIDSIKESLRQTALWIKNDGGIRSIKILKEDTVGDVAEVTVEVTRGGGDCSVVHYRLIHEQGAWKIDAISSEPTRPATGTVQ